MFITLPKIFDTMPGGSIIGAAFFITVLFAALTSAISLMETIVSILCDKLGLKRTPACLIVLGFSLVMGLLSCFGYSIFSAFKFLALQVLDFFDFISNSVLVPIVALATGLFVGYFLKPKAIIDEVSLKNPFKQQGLFRIMIKYIAPIFTILILISSILDVFGIIKI